MSTDTRICGLAVGGQPPTATLDGQFSSKPLPAALEFAARTLDLFAVADAADLARAVGGGAGTAHNDLCRLAAHNRLLCLSATHDDGTRLGSSATAENLAVAGRERIADLSRRAEACQLAQEVIDRHGPWAAFARTRAAIARGLKASGQITPAESAFAAARCRAIADERFAALVNSVGASDMFKGGKRVVPDCRGFRTRRSERVRTWLNGELRSVLDRHSVAIDTPTHESLTDIQLCNWPLPALGTAPLTYFADLQAAEHLGFALATARDGKCPAKFDPVAYRRLVRTAGLPEVFHAPDGRALVRVDLSELPGAVLAARQARAVGIFGPSCPGEVRSQDGRDRRELPEAARPAVLRLLAAGAGFSATARCAGWRTGCPVTAAQVERLDRALCKRAPEVMAHLTDPWLATVAHEVGRAPDEVAQLVASADSNDGSFLRRFAAGGLADALGEPSGFDDHLPERLTQHLQCNATHPAAGAGRSGPTTVAAWWRRMYRSEMWFLTGPRLPSPERPNDRYLAFEQDLRDAIDAASFALWAAGHRVVARTDDELLVETSPKSIEAVAGVVCRGLAEVLEGTRADVRAESVERW